MIKQLASGAALLACLLPAQAAIQTYEWSFTNFLDLEGGWPENTSIKGSFTVEDVNGNGAFEASELRSLVYSYTDYVNCAACTISRFSYTPGGTLDFDIRKREYFDWGSASQGINVGHSWEHFSAASGYEPYINGGRWTDNTIASVSAVPEPGTYLMLGAGLLAVAGLARRRARTQGWDAGRKAGDSLHM